MKTEFYVGQMVRDDGRFKGSIGIVKTVDCKLGGEAYPILVDYGNKSTRVYTADGRYTTREDPSLTPIDQPATKLTEWQRNELKNNFMSNYKYASEGMDWNSLADDNISFIESVLSQPEPKMWTPKEGEMCLFRDYDETTWIADVFVGMNDPVSTYPYCSKTENVWRRCRPFSLELIGTTDNPPI